ncbi:Peptidoglycan-binding domain 1 protein [Thalassoporum mexicanum PCC 7367]|uniref:peptidoglycan-binding protein n=1 Tax=Thalassoporum mexicanum TaxID=3457544 RepID=UPI00029FDD48|nr:peptidoglycan-binding protein [Pseudanabaena sp. PCC 7367]AFY71502.1 Peptidoglycan-binding domain 1 protein [Pseudanabaena sp. PCC 7367]
MPLVRDVVGACDTGQIRGLSLQIIAVMNTLVTNVLVNFDDLNVDVNGDQINPFVQPAAKESLRLAINKRGTKLVVNSAFRTVAQQYLLRRQFELGLCGIFAAARPGFSNHEGGLALDIQDPQGWRPFLEQHSWYWLGAFDPPHFDYQFRAASRQDLGIVGVKAFQRLWNQNNPTDQIAEDGIYGAQTGARIANSPAEGFGAAPIRTLGLAEPRMEGDDVKALQEALNNNQLVEINIPVNGIFDPATAEAVKQFQEATQLLAVDGIVGAMTRRRLGLD